MAAILRSVEGCGRFRQSSGYGLGLGVGVGTTGPRPGAGGSEMLIGVGVGLGALSPGSFAMLVASLRNQLLLAPATTSGGGVYQRFPGYGPSAPDMNWCHPGAATKTPSEPLIIVWWMSRMSPTHIAAARSGVNPTVTASLKLSVVPVLAATLRSPK